MFFWNEYLVSAGLNCFQLEGRLCEWAQLHYSTHVLFSQDI